MLGVRRARLTRRPLACTSRVQSREDMNQRHRIQLFDDWAEHYDQSVQGDGDFPFDGYEQVLDEVTKVTHAQSGMKVLDLGIGTGNLAARFADLGCDIWGIDFSAEMLAKALEKLPQAVLIQAGLLDVWLAELDHRFDRIVSGYVLHEFDLPTKVGLLQQLAQCHLAANGQIVIGDIAFPTTQARERAHQRWIDLWDEEEYYWAADETIRACKSVGLQVTYKQISSCGSVFAIERTVSG
jgi:putative AdoMet-dependent methyltransferase